MKSLPKIVAKQMFIIIIILLLVPQIGIGSDLNSTPAKLAKNVGFVIAHRGAMKERPESTLSAFSKAIEIGANCIEIDLRLSKDGHLVLIHDSTVDRTTNGKGKVNSLTLKELKSLDAGSFFSKKYQGERIPTFQEALELTKGKAFLMLDLKLNGEDYNQKVAAEVLKYGDPKQMILGVRNLDQIKEFRKFLPGSLQLGLIPSPKSIDEFCKAGVDVIRLWERQLIDPSLVEKIHKHKKKVHINVSDNSVMNILSMLIQNQPSFLLSDDTRKLRNTLDKISSLEKEMQVVASHVESGSSTKILPGISKKSELSFLNREYKMEQIPEEFSNQPRILFNGGEGNQIKIRFLKPTVLFTALQYNDSGSWNFPDGKSPEDFGWRLLKNRKYLGTSNAKVKKRPHFASVYYREFRKNDVLENMPAWWLCLAVMPVDQAKAVPGFQVGAYYTPPKVIPYYSYEKWSVQNGDFELPVFENKKQFSNWQEKTRSEFIKNMLFQYEDKPEIAAVGSPVLKEKYLQQEFHVSIQGNRLFRFFRLEPHNQTVKNEDSKSPTIVCFMGHGKIKQVLEEKKSYQHACAARFAEQGYLVYAMENVGMEPDKNNHLEIDRLLKLNGLSWYSLLFAHQKILLEHVFSDPSVNTSKVGAAGVSTGGLLALSASVIEPRIAATSVQGIFGSMRISFIQDRNRHCPCGAIPNLIPKYDLPILALLVTPRAMHVSNATKDGFSPSEAKRCLNIISPIYQQAGGKEPFFTSPTGHHEFAVNEAFEFFAQQLKQN
jgi:glycerophosphoryl diester phosphodiesterase/dienelactone hydrolase